MSCSVVDLFCGVGGLTHGFVLEGMRVVAGVDADESCRYAYESNNAGARFIHRQIENLTAQEVRELYSDHHVKVLVGCAPCQPFSQYTQKMTDPAGRWRLVPLFGQLITDVQPDVVSMENVPYLVTHRKGEVFRQFVDMLEHAGYHVTVDKSVYCPDYGVPQERTRLVLFASRFGELSLLPPTHDPEDYLTVEDAIAGLPAIEAGETHPDDPVHRAAGLSDMNLKRIQASLPGGTWLDWPEELRVACHLRKTGDGYTSVYGRMAWRQQAPTITTNAYNYGSGRFGHPDQDRAISLREAALLQGFPADYAFVAPQKPVYLKEVGRHIGNAVPVSLGRAIARSIREHVEQHVEG